MMNNSINQDDDLIVSEINYTMNISFPGDPSVKVKLEFAETDEYAVIYLNEDELQLPEEVRIKVFDAFRSFDRDQALFFIENSVLGLYQIGYLNRDYEHPDPDEMVEIEIEI